MDSSTGVASVTNARWVVPSMLTSRPQGPGSLSAGVASVPSGLSTTAQSFWATVLLIAAALVTVRLAPNAGTATRAATASRRIAIRFFIPSVS